MEEAASVGDSPPREADPGPSLSPGLGAWAASVLGVAVVALWARLTILPQVFVAGLVLPEFPDVHYHVRRIVQTVESFPRVSVMDPFLNWPEGGPCPWPAGFDWLAALYVLAVGDTSSAEAIARAAAGFPVVLGLGVVALTMTIAARLVRRGSSGLGAVVAAGVIAALLPQAVIVSQLGSVDHHVAEALAMAGLGAWVLWGVDTSESATPGARGFWLRWELVGFALVVFAGSVFNGSILYVTIALGTWIAYQLWRPARPGDRFSVLGTGFPALATATVALALMNQAAVAEHGMAIDFRFPSHLQPILHGIAALGCLGAGLAAHHLGRDRPTLPRVAVRAAALALTSGALAALGLLAVRGAGSEMAGGLVGWLWRSDPWLAGINEFQPLFPSLALWRPETWHRVWQIHGLFGLLAPLLLPLGVWVAVRERPVVGSCFALWTLALVVLTLVQTRFGRVLTPNLAVASALALAFLAHHLLARRLLAGRASASHGTTRMAGLAVAAAVAAMSLADPAIRRSLTWQAPRQPSALESASLYLRTRAAPAPAGVLTKWDYGHTVLAVARRPVVAAGFGPWPGERGFAEVKASLSGDEDALLSLMERRRLDHLVTGLYAFLPSVHVADPDAEPPFWVSPEDGRVEANLGFFAARPLSPLILGGTGIPAAGLRHAAHLRPRFASPQRIPGLDAPVFQLWVYERVPGARLTGRAAANARVVARTRIAVQGAMLPYEAWTEAGEDGRFELVLPLPTGPVEAGLSAAHAYEIRIDDAVAIEVDVPEAAVAEGTEIDLGGSGSKRLARRGPP